MIANNDAQLLEQQYLTFVLGDDVYGVDILQVQEIRGWEAPLTIPDTPEYVKGVANLRGQIVPIIDLRIRFNLPHVEYSSTTVTIVLSVQAEQDHVMGIVVDAVSDVLQVSTSEIGNPPRLGSNINTSFMRGVVSRDRMIMLLDANTLLDPEAFEQLTRASLG